MPPKIPLLVMLAAILGTFVQVGALRIAFDKLGLAPDAVIWLLLLLTLLGSLVNIPLFTVMAATQPQEDFLITLPAHWRRSLHMLPGRTIVAINVGGGLMPLAFSLHLLLHTPLALDHVAIITAVVTLFAYHSSALVPGVGVVMTLLTAPLAAAFTSISLDLAHAAPLAYIGGTLGVLLGADVLRLKEVGQTGAPVVSMGGAGSFDGVFLTGIIAILLT